MCPINFGGTRMHLDTLSICGEIYWIEPTLTTINSDEQNRYSVNVWKYLLITVQTLNLEEDIISYYV